MGFKDKIQKRGTMIFIFLISMCFSKLFYIYRVGTSQSTLSLWAVCDGWSWTGQGCVTSQRSWHPCRNWWEVLSCQRSDCQTSVILFYLLQVWHCFCSCLKQSMRLWNLICNHDRQHIIHIESFWDPLYFIIWSNPLPLYSAGNCE